MSSTLIKVFALTVAIVAYADGPKHIWASHDLYLYCTVGAMLGSFLAISVWPEKEETARQTATKFLCSVVSALSFAPMLTALLGFGLNPDNTVGVSAGVGFTAVSVFHLARPVFDRVIPQLIEAFLNKWTK